MLASYSLCLLLWQAKCPHPGSLGTSRLCFSEVRAMPFPGISLGSTQFPGFSENSCFLLLNPPPPCTSTYHLHPVQSWKDFVEQRGLDGVTRRQSGVREGARAGDLSKTCCLHDFLPPGPNASLSPSFNNAVKSQIHQDGPIGERRAPSSLLPRAPQLQHTSPGGTYLI